MFSLGATFKLVTSKELSELISHFGAKNYFFVIWHLGYFVLTQDYDHNVHFMLVIGQLLQGISRVALKGVYTTLSPEGLKYNTLP